MASSKQYIGALDQGTTSTRFTIFDRRGRLRAFDQMEHAQHYPQPGWVEHDPNEIVEKTLKVMVGAFSRSGLEPGDLDSLGITNQRETTVIWERESGRPVYNAIVWQDTRTAALCEEIDRKHGALVRRRTGLPVATYFSASKIRWILDNVPGARKKAEAGDLLFGTIDSWLIWNLCGGVHAMDATNASRTLLMNLDTLDWDPELLSLFDIPRALLPPIRSSSEIFGFTHKVDINLPVAGALGDQQAALFGQACFSAGQIKNTYGTGCFLLLNTGTRRVTSGHGLLTTVARALPGEAPHFALEGSVAMAGASVQWLRDNLGIIASSGEVEALAASVPDNGDVYFVPAFSGLFAPHWRQDARGIFAGLTRYATKAHLARAVLESTAFQTREVIEAMTKDVELKIRDLRVDGGMTVNNLLMQFQADILGIDVVRPLVTETTALGAAYAAGLATGFWKNQDELRAHWSEDRRWKPARHADSRDSRWQSWQKAVQKSLGWTEG